MEDNNTTITTTTGPEGQSGAPAERQEAQQEQQQQQQQQLQDEENKKAMLVCPTAAVKAKRSSPAAISTRKKKRKLKPEDFPKRPLSAYNIFFKEAREKLLLSKKDWQQQEQQPAVPPAAPEPTDESQKGGEQAADGEGTTNSKTTTNEESSDKKDSDKDDDDDDGLLNLKSSMVKYIASMWKTADAEVRERVDRIAKADMQRYKEEVQAYEEEMVLKKKREREEKARRNKEEWQKVRDEHQQDSTTTMKDSSGRSNNSAAGSSSSIHRDGGLPYSQGNAGEEMRSKGGRPEERGKAWSHTSSSLDGAPSNGRHAAANPEDEMHMLLADETNALEQAESCKARQLSLARRLQACHPESQVLAALEKKRESLGLPPLVATKEHHNSERGMFGSTGVRGPMGGGRGRVLSPLSSMSRSPLGLKPTLDQDYQHGLLPPPPRDYMLMPSRAAQDASMHHMRLRHEEAAMFRLKRAREQEFAGLHQQRGYHYASMHRDATLSELAVQRQKLLEKERSVSHMMERMESTNRASYGRLPGSLPGVGGPPDPRDFSRQHPHHYRVEEEPTTPTETFSSSSFNGANTTVTTGRH